MVNIEDLKRVGVEVTDEHKDGKLLIDIFTVI